MELSSERWNKQNVAVSAIREMVEDLENLKTKTEESNGGRGRIGKNNDSINKYLDELIWRISQKSYG